MKHVMDPHQKVKASSRAWTFTTANTPPIMPSSDYTAASGALKLKGSGVDKKKKKKKPKPTESTSENATASTDVTISKSPSETPQRSMSPTEAEQELRQAGGRQKTEAELRYEEARRKRLEEKIRKEGVKTHKEKVEELNKYLSGLSEHHDMPKIGPG